MDLKKLLQKRPSKKQILQIVDYVGVNKTRFKSLVNIYKAGPYRITQSAAWPLSYCIENHPLLVVPHLKSLLDFVEEPGADMAVRRNTMRLLQFIDIPKRYHGRIIDLGFRFLQNKKETIAVKVFSMFVLARLVMNLPDLRNELKVVIEDQLPYASPAFLSRARKVLREINSQ